MKSISVTVTVLLIVSFSVHQTTSDEKSNKFHRISKDDRQKSSTHSSHDSRETSLESNRAIPMAFLKELANISDISELFENFVNPESLHLPLEPHHKLPRNIVERVTDGFPKEAGCIPDNTLVELKALNPSTDPKIMYYPKCTRVKRCGGCCVSPLLSCQPIEEQTTSFKVYKLKYINDRRFNFLSQERVVLVEHTKCACSCRVKEEHCAEKQRYDKTLCECQCDNDDDKKICLEQEDKRWEPKTCTCECRDMQTCTTGTVFDKHLCKCVEISDPSVILNRGALSPLFDRRRVSVKTMSVTSNESAGWNVP